MGAAVARQAACIRGRFDGPEFDRTIEVTTGPLGYRVNILYIDHYAGGPVWGMEYRPFYLGREWARLGHRVTIVAASYAHVRTRQPDVKGRYSLGRVDGVDYVWCQTPTYEGNGVGRVVNIAVFLSRLREWRYWLDHRPDVVIASSTYPVDFMPARALAKRFGATLVWEVHDLWPLSPIELGGMSRWHPFILWMQRSENAACRHADIVVSMLPHADVHLMEHGMSQSKFVYIPNGVDPDEWSGSQRDELPRSHAGVLQEAKEKGELLVGYAGAHGVANGLDTLLDAASLAREMPIRWVLVGGGAQKGWLQQRVRAEGLERVSFLDGVPRSAIPALLEAMDVLYIGLRSESVYRYGVSPNKLMDYMMAGRPIVCAIEAGNDPVGEVGCGVTIRPNDAKEIVRAVDGFASVNVSERRAIGARGRLHIESNNLYPMLARRFLEAMG